MKSQNTKSSSKIGHFFGLYLTREHNYKEIGKNLHSARKKSELSEQAGVIMIRASSLPHSLNLKPTQMFYPTVHLSYSPG